MARWSNGIARIHSLVDAAATDLLVNNVSYGLGNQVVVPETGYPYSRHARLVNQAPTLSFEAEDIATVLGLISSLLGKCIASDGSHPGVVVFNQKHDPCTASGRYTTANHQSITMASGHVFIDSVSLPAGRAGSVSLMAHAATTSPTVPPMTAAYNVSIPAQPLNNGYMAFDCRIAGIDLTQVTQIQVDFNPKFDKPIYAGSIWPTLVDPQKVEAVIRITHDNTELFDAYPHTSGKFTEDGIVATHANSFIQMRRINDVGAPTPIASNHHIKGTCYGLVTIPTPYQASGTNAGSQVVEITCLDDASNVPIVWSLAQALTDL